MASSMLAARDKAAAAAAATAAAEEDQDYEQPIARPQKVLPVDSHTAHIRQNGFANSDGTVLHSSDLPPPLDLAKLFEMATRDPNFNRHHTRTSLLDLADSSSATTATSPDKKKKNVEYVTSKASAAAEDDPSSAATAPTTRRKKAPSRAASIKSEKDVDKSGSLKRKKKLTMSVSMEPEGASTKQQQQQQQPDGASQFDTFQAQMLALRNNKRPVSPVSPKSPAKPLPEFQPPSGSRTSSPPASPASPAETPAPPPAPPKDHRDPSLSVAERRILARSLTPQQIAEMNAVAEAAKKHPPPPAHHLLFIPPQNHPRRVSSPEDKRPAIRSVSTTDMAATSKQTGVDAAQQRLAVSVKVSDRKYNEQIAPLVQQPRSLNKNTVSKARISRNDSVLAAEAKAAAAISEVEAATNDFQEGSYLAKKSNAASTTASSTTATASSAGGSTIAPTADKKKPLRKQQSVTQRISSFFGIGGGSSSSSSGAAAAASSASTSPTFKNTESRMSEAMDTTTSHADEYPDRPYHYSEHVRAAQQEQEHAAHQTELTATDSPGFHMMEKMGWHPGHGLGKREQGVLETPPECEPETARADFEEGHSLNREDNELKYEEKQHHFDGPVPSPSTDAANRLAKVHLRQDKVQDKTNLS